MSSLKFTYYLRNKDERRFTKNFSRKKSIVEAHETRNLEEYGWVPAMYW